MKSRKIAVFEALNHARKEIYVGTTERPLAEIVDTRLAALPPEIAHWAKAEELSIRGLSEAMPAADAREFIDVYVSYIERDGWKILRQRPDS